MSVRDLLVAQATWAESEALAVPAKMVWDSSARAEEALVARAGLGVDLWASALEDLALLEEAPESVVMERLAQSAAGRASAAWVEQAESVALVWWVPSPAGWVELPVEEGWALNLRGVPAKRRSMVRSKRKACWLK
jgi:hypothetical protein